MEVDKHKILVWCGNSPNQKALANKLALRYNVTAIVIDRHTKMKKKNEPSLILYKIIDRIRFRKIYGAWKWLMKFYANKYKQWPDVPIIRVGNINDEQAVNFTLKEKPDLIVVSGTSLIRQSLLDLTVKIGIINLHTGLSPYIKGGPNCTNWCIANNEWHLVGNTIMWLNAGIDSGNIISSEVIDIRQAPSLKQAHKMVMEHAHDLYCNAIEHLLNNTKTYNSVPQHSIAPGKLYLNKMWTAGKRKLLVFNWKRRNAVTEFPKVKTVALS